ncbi:MAG TPA: hypothetical protein EYQ81_10615 [Sneathiellales bacterium]|jgi:hypothetical protein|nr:hypothetical protein [Sneathiellales bacterium]
MGISQFAARIVTLTACTLGSSTFPPPAHAGDVFMLGENLYKTCVKDPTFCQGYVSGVADVMFGTEVSILNSQACPQPGTTIGDVSATTVEWMEKNPKRLGYTAYSVVAVALAESFPCK